MHVWQRRMDQLTDRVMDRIGRPRDRREHTTPHYWARAGMGAPATARRVPALVITLNPYAGWVRVTRSHWPVKRDKQLCASTNESKMLRIARKRAHIHANGERGKGTHKNQKARTKVHVDTWIRGYVDTCMWIRGVSTWCPKTALTEGAVARARHLREGDLTTQRMSETLSHICSPRVRSLAGLAPRRDEILAGTWELGSPAAPPPAASL